MGAIKVFFKNRRVQLHPLHLFIGASVSLLLDRHCQSGYNTMYCKMQQNNNFLFPEKSWSYFSSWTCGQSRINDFFKRNCPRQNSFRLNKSRRRKFLALLCHFVCCGFRLLRFFTFPGCSPKLHPRRAAFQKPQMLQGWG